MKVTVVTAVFNRAADLKSTIQSVLECTHPNLDYIVIDGGSTDGTVNVLRAHDSCLKFWLSEPDAGVYDAMNKGWNLADPESRVLFLGAGDRLIRLPEYDEGDRHGFDILYGNVQLENGRSFQARTGFWLKLYNSLHHQALLIPKRLHPAPPFDLSYPFYADFDFNQRLSKSGARFHFDSQFSVFAAPGGLTSELRLDELTNIIRKNYGQFWSGLSLLGYSLAKVLPFSGRLRPIR